MKYLVVVITICALLCCCTAHHTAEHSSSVYGQMSSLELDLPYWKLETRNAAFFCFWRFHRFRSKRHELKFCRLELDLTF